MVNAIRFVDVLTQLDYRNIGVFSKTVQLKNLKTPFFHSQRKAEAFDYARVVALLPTTAIHWQSYRWLSHLRVA